MKSVAVTGYTGYIGSQLYRYLIQNGIPTVGIDRVTSVSEIATLLKTNQVDTVFHLAARTDYAQTDTSISEIISVNVTLGCWVLEAMKQAGVRTIISCGTTWEYYHSDTARPLNFYAASKLAFKQFLHYYADADSFQTVSVMIPDTYGPADPRPKILNLILTAIQNQQPLDVTEGRQQLDLVHIRDVIAGIVASVPAESQPGFFEYTLTSGEAIELRELSDRIAELTGQSPQLHWGVRPYRPREVFATYRGGVRPAGWAPLVSLETGISELISAGGPS